MDFAVPAEHRIKSKEIEMKDRYVDLDSELKKKLCNMKVTVIPIVNLFSKGLVKGLEDLEIRG